MINIDLTDTHGIVLYEEQVNISIAQTLLGRLGQPKDITDVVALLVAEDARWVALQNICATGGIK